MVDLQSLSPENLLEVQQKIKMYSKKMNKLNAEMSEMVEKLNDILQLEGDLENL